MTSPKILRALPGLVAMVLLVAACGSSGDPTSFDDQVEDGRSLAERNFVQGCQVELADAPDPELADAANQVCECAYDRFSGNAQDVPASETITFEQFEELDDQLREDINSLEDSEAGRVVADAVRTCIQQIATT